MIFRYHLIHILTWTSSCKVSSKKKIQAWIFRRAEKFRAQTGTFLTGKWKMRWKMFINLRIWVERRFWRFCDVMEVESESEVWVASSTHVTHCLYSKLHAFNATRIFGCSMNDNVLIQYLLWIMKVIWASGNLVALLGFVARLSIWNRDEIVNGNKKSQRKLIQYSLLMLCSVQQSVSVGFLTTRQSAKKSVERMKKIHISIHTHTHSQHMNNCILVCKCRIDVSR